MVACPKGQVPPHWLKLTQAERDSRLSRHRNPRPGRSYPAHTGSPPWGSPRPASRSTTPNDGRTTRGAIGTTSRNRPGDTRNLIISPRCSRDGRSSPWWWPMAQQSRPPRAASLWDAPYDAAGAVGADGAGREGGLLAVREADRAGSAVGSGSRRRRPRPPPRPGAQTLPRLPDGREPGHFASDAGKGPRRGS